MTGTLDALLRVVRGNGSLPDPAAVRASFGPRVTELDRGIGVARDRSNRDADQRLGRVADSVRAAVAAAGAAVDAEVPGEVVPIETLEAFRAVEAQEAMAAVTRGGPVGPVPGPLEAVTLALPGAGGGGPPAAVEPGSVAVPVVMPAPVTGAADASPSTRTGTALDALAPLLDRLARPPARPPAGLQGWRRL